MELRPMERGKQQVLFNYLPDATFDYEGGRLICRVTDIEGEQAHLRNEEALRHAIRHYVFGTTTNQRWDPNHIIGLPDLHSQPDSLRYIVPTGVRFDLFPNTWQCQNPACRRVWVYGDMNELARVNPSRQCRNCGERLAQLYQVFIHSCGQIEQVRPPHGCPRHRNASLVLDDRRSQQARNFGWICPECGREVAKFIVKCPICSRPEKDEWMSPVPHRANAAYYAHYVRLVDIPPVQQIIAQHGREGIVLKLLKGIQPLQPSNRAAAEPIRQKLTDPTLSHEIRRYLETMLTELIGSQDIGSFPDLGDLKDEAIEAAAEYWGVMRELKTHTISQREKALSHSSPELGERLRTVPKVLERVGVSEVLLVEDFPVVTAVFGYTRDSFEPRPADKQPTTFRAFPPGRTGRQRTVLVDSGEAEGILFRLAPNQVINWLRIRGLTDLPENSTEMDQRLWLLQNIEPVDRFVSQNISPATQAVFGLIHSMAHILARAAAVLAGFERSGIAEYLFPSVPGFVLFSNRTDFSIGGMWTLFETHLPELFARSIDLESRTCVYDPVCMEHGGACHACIHLPETSCAHLNRALSRAFLFGTGFDNRGYWDGVFKA